MRDEAVPEMQVEVGVAATDAGDKVILVGLYGVFCSVGVMQVWRTELELYAGIVQKLFQAAGEFIVEHLLLGGEAAVGEVGVEDASGSDDFAFTARGEWIR